MDRHPRRHGQAIGRFGRVRPGLAALPVLCLAVTLAAVWWGLSARGGSDVGGDAASNVADSVRAPDGMATGDASGVASSGDSPSRDGAFLAALARDAAGADPSRDGVVARQAWTEERSLPLAAADVLRAYADEPTASLAMSGYLDIKGDVWGAIVRDARGWVDMVGCTAGKDDASCSVSVVRLAPKGQGRTGSEGS